jgi:hypothetical protein
VRGCIVVGLERMAPRQHPIPPLRGINRYSVIDMG